MHTYGQRLKVFAWVILFTVVSVDGWAEDHHLTADQLREANAIATTIWSPFCPGRTLTSCTSRKAAEWRKDIRTWVADDMSADDIRRHLQARVPHFDMETYPRSMFLSRSLAAGACGAAILLVGLVFFVRRQSTPTDEEELLTPSPSHARRQLEVELLALND